MERDNKEKLKLLNFEESVKYLYGLGNEVLAMKLGLENPRRLFHALGNPHEKFLKVQVAGTNGKGSVCAFLEAICRSAGMKTGLYTSPHLISVTERIKINGQEIREKDFARHTFTVKNLIEEINRKKTAQSSEHSVFAPTFFEQMTAIALLAFVENQVDIAILETGMGGRLDATTAAQAEIVGITPIDYDHQQYLGETLSEIAGEKAAVIRPQVKAVIARQRSEAEAVIHQRCQETGVFPVFTDFELPQVKLSLKGKHQEENAKVAVRLAEFLEIEKKHIIQGLETAVHRGRLEFYRGMLFDGSHNVAGALALRAYLEEFHPNDKLALIFGAMKDKQLAEITSILFPLADKIVLTQTQNPRAATAQELAKLTDKNCILTESATEALETVKNFENHLICVTGSLYVVGEVQKIV